jgi:hypothetical protein
VLRLGLLISLAVFVIQQRGSCTACPEYGGCLVVRASQLQAGANHDYSPLVLLYLRQQDDFDLAAAAILDLADSSFNVRVSRRSCFDAKRTVTADQVSLYIIP